MVFYRRFIDDVIGIWCPHHNHEQDTLEWDHFKNKMNAFPGLTWEFSERAKTINFMDMTSSINKSNRIKTTCSKNDSTCTFTSPPPPTPLTRQDYSLALYTVLCSGSSRYAQTMRINYNEQKPFLSASLPVATKEMKSDHYSTKPLRVQKQTVDQHKMRMTTTTASSSTYRFIQTIPHLPVSRQNGKHMSPNLNGNCPWNT